MKLKRAEKNHLLQLKLNVAAIANFKKIYSKFHANFTQLVEMYKI